MRTIILFFTNILKLTKVVIIVVSTIIINKFLKLKMTAEILAYIRLKPSVRLSSNRSGFFVIREREITLNRVSI